MNRDPAFFDLGLCGPKRQDLTVRRDTQPEDWYPHGAGRVKKFNDLPPDLRRNVNVDGYLTTASPVRLPRFRRLKSTTWSLS